MRRDAHILAELEIMKSLVPAHDGAAVSPHILNSTIRKDCLARIERLVSQK